MGKLIVVEGLDSSGKQTQTEYLYKSLKEQGEKVMKISFPCYDSDSSALVKMYLSGSFGENAEDVNPFAASSFYAVDRYASFKTGWGKFYNSGGVVIADRYTTSNMIHQAGKIKDKGERDKYLKWLYEYEYLYLGLPEPDLVLFLEMEPEVSARLMKERANKITGEKEKDIHEKDASHLKNSYDSAVYVAEKFDWVKIKCVKNDELRSIEDIHNELLSLTLEELKKEVL